MEDSSIDSFPATNPLKNSFGASRKLYWRMKLQKRGNWLCF